MLHCFVKVDQFVLVVVIVYQVPTQTCLAGFNIETASYLFHYVWALYQLFINFLSTAYQLFINFYQLFVSTFYQLFVSFYQLVYQLFINFYQHFINFLLTVTNCLSTFYQSLSTFYQLFINFINFLSTFYPLLSTFYQQYQLFINVLSTFLSTFFYQLYQLFINFLSTFNCFSFMSYISALPNIIFALHSLCSIDQSTFASYVSGAPQFRSPPVAANMHLKMIQVCLSTLFDASTPTASEGPLDIHV